MYMSTSATCAVQPLGHRLTRDDSKPILNTSNALHRKRVEAEGGFYVSEWRSARIDAAPLQTDTFAPDHYIQAQGLFTINLLRLEA